MGWMGKIVGGTIGLALGGPLGAIAGAAFGHFFDQTSAMTRSGGMQGPRLSSHEDAQMTFFVAAFSMLAKLVQADGRVTADEIATIERFMQQDLRLSPASRRVAIDIFNTAKTSPHAFDDFARQFYGAFRHRPEILAFMLDILVRVAMADRDISAAEETLIRRAARIFGLPEPGYQNLKSSAAPSNDRFYHVLGVTPEASNEEIKGRYRTLVKEFHPDRIAAKGLPDEFTEFAESKFREIQEAYEAVKKERGIA
jgi:DnaJ like chaperone protein